MESGLLNILKNLAITFEGNTRGGDMRIRPQELSMCMCKIN